MVSQVYRVLNCSKMDVEYGSTYKVLEVCRNFCSGLVILLLVLLSLLDVTNLKKFGYW